jgi:hypothetical protein
MGVPVLVHCVTLPRAEYIIGLAIILDPPVATGYSYSVDPNGPLFTSVVAPTTVAGLPLTTNLTLSYNGTSTQITPGVYYNFPQPVSGFQITGIPESFSVDPASTQAFVTGLTFNESGNANITMIPLTSPEVSTAPEPSTITLVGTAFTTLAGYFGWRRRKQPA